MYLNNSLPKLVPGPLNLIIARDLFEELGIDVQGVKVNCELNIATAL